MAELLSQASVQPHGLKSGNTVTGTIIGKNPKSLIVDIGAKAEALVQDREYQAAATYIQSLNVGDKITARVVYPETDTGHVLISLRDTARKTLWDKLVNAKSNQETIIVRGIKTNQGGIVAQLDQLTGFIPTSHLSKNLINQPEILINRQIKVKVLEADPPTNRLIFSEKAVSEADQMAQIKKALSTVKVGNLLTGKVVGIVPFGVFVSIPLESEGKHLDFEGLVHISELSWAKIETPEEVVTEGDEVQVKVIDVNPEANSLALSIKALEKDPFEKLGEKYPQGKSLTGTVTKVNEFGIFVEIEPGIEALLHISKVPADKSFKVGDQVNVTIEEIDTAKHRVSLNLVLTSKPIGYK